MSDGVGEEMMSFNRRGGQVVHCEGGKDPEELWKAVGAGIKRARWKPLVRVGCWGVECRSLRLEERKLFYLLNHGRAAVEVTPTSKWDLESCTDLRTQESVDGRKIPLRSLELRILECR